MPKVHWTGVFVAIMLRPRFPRAMTIMNMIWPLIPSFIGGLLIGIGAKRAMRTTAIVAGIAIAVLVILGKLGIDSGSMDEWVRSSSGWVGDKVEGAGRYLVAFLPAAGAALVGGVVGFHR